MVQVHTVTLYGTHAWRYPCFIFIFAIKSLIILLIICLFASLLLFVNSTQQMTKGEQKSNGIRKEL